MPTDETKETWVDRIKCWIGNDRKTAWIVIAGVCGVVLLALSCWIGPKEVSADGNGYDAQRYTEELEARLEAMVASVRGAGTCRAMVTLENGVEYLYANEEKTNSDRTQSDSGDVSTRDDNQKTVVTVDAGDGRQGLLVTEIQPTVRGVVVLCEGAGNEEVATLVREAVKTALNITDRRVCVVPLS